MESKNHHHYYCYFGSCLRVESMTTMSWCVCAAVVVAVGGDGGVAMPSYKRHESLFVKQNRVREIQIQRVWTKRRSQTSTMICLRLISNTREAMMYNRKLFLNVHAKWLGPTFFLKLLQGTISRLVVRIFILCYKTICAYCKTKTILFCPKISGVSQSYVR